MVVSSDFLEKIHQFLDKQISISDLEEWLVSHEPWLLRDPDSDDSDLVGTVELGLAEMNAGIRSDIDFRELLKQEIIGKTETILEDYPETNNYTVTGSSNIIIQSFAYDTEPASIDIIQMSFQ